MSDELIIDQQNGIAIVTLNRPERLNAVTYDMLKEISERVPPLLNDPEVFIVIFTGAGEKAFCAGFDLDTVKSLKKSEYRDFFKLLERFIVILRNARNCVTIAAINGYAVGFGAILATACDFRFFSDNAAFKLPEIDLSIFPGMGAAVGLMQLVSPSKTKEILMTGRMIPADEAKSIGIADKIFAQSELMSETMKFADDLAKKDRKLLIRTKNLVDMMVGRELTDAIDVEGMFTEEWLQEVEKS